MDNQQELNARQVAWLIGTMIIAGGLLSLPKSLIEIAQMDAWLCELGGGLYALCIAYALYQLARRFPGKNIFEIAFELTGRLGGTIISLLLLVYLWSILTRDTRIFVDFVSTTLLPRTPVDIVMYLFIVVLIYYGRSSVEISARVNDFIFPSFVLVLVALPFLLTNELSFQRTEPMLGRGAYEVLTGNLLPIGWYGDVLLGGCFLHTLKSAQHFHVSMRHAITAATFVLSLMLFTIIAVLGSKVAGRLMFPTYVLVEQIHITDFLDRVELLIFSFWIPAFLIKSSFIFSAIMIGLRSLSGDRDHPVFARQTGWIILLSTLVGFKTVTETLNFGNYGAIVIMAVVHPLTIGVLLAVGLVKKRPEQEERPDDRKPHMQQQGMMNRIPLRRWSIGTNGLLLGGAAVLAVGMAFGDKWSLVGKGSSIGFGLLILLAAVSAYMEFRCVKLSTATSGRQKGRS